MAYAGYLLKIGNYTVEQGKYIKANSYSAYANVQDLDSYRDADGVLHRNALTHVPIKVEFETPAMLTDVSFADFMRKIQSNYINATERKVLATVYVPEYDNYITQEMYVPDIKPSIYTTHGGRVRYNAIRIALIGY